MTNSRDKWGIKKDAAGLNEALVMADLCKSFGICIIVVELNIGVNKIQIRTR